MIIEYKKENEIAFEDLKDKECFFSNGVLYMKILSQDLKEYNISCVNAIDRDALPRLPRLPRREHRGGLRGPRCGLRRAAGEAERSSGLQEVLSAADTGCASERCR